MTLYTSPIMKRVPQLIAVIGMALLRTAPGAQPYPSKPVRIIVPIGTGGVTDILTRILSQRLATIWSQQVIVDNRPGCGSNVGIEIAAKAPADGYTLLMAQPAFTVTEAGLRGYEFTGWTGLVAPTGTPRAVIDRVHADAAKALASPEVIQALYSSGLEPAGPTSPEEFAAFLRAEISKWAKVVKASGAKAD